MNSSKGFWIQLDPRIRLYSILSLVFVVLITPIQYYEKFFLYIALVLFLGILSKLRIKHYIIRFLLFFPLLIFFALSLLLFSDKNVPDQILIISNLTIKTFLTFSCFSILVLTEQFPQLIKTLDAMRVPKAIVSVLEFAHRYVLLFQQEAGRMVTARKSRSFNKKRTFRDIKAGATLVSLFLFRVLERSQRIYIAMLSRGYRDTIPHSNHAPLMLSRKDYIFCILFSLFLVAIRVFV